MSRPNESGATKGRGLVISRSFFVATAFLLVFTVGCWEQWSDTWFPQMKRQKAVQAFETVGYGVQVEGLSPPEGTVPAVDAPPADVGENDIVAQNALANPRPMSLDSLENGRVQYDIYCATCHGMTGLGDGPVSATGELRGPFAGVFAVAGPGSMVKLQKLSDGRIYAAIRYGKRRMPSYKRIPSDDRWDIVNYVRYLNGQTGGIAQKEDGQ